MVMYSHSKLSSFEQCPMKFKFQYIDRLKPEIEYTIEGFLGNMVHETLEWIHKQIIKGISIDLDSAIEYYARLWHSKYNKDIRIVKEEYDSEYYFNRGIKFIINYFTSNYPFSDNSIATEKRIIIRLDSQGKYILQGYIDRIVHNLDTNIFEIHDYKTGSFLKSQEELDNDRQLALYSIGIRENFSQAQDVHLVWHFLAHNQKMTSKRTIEQLDSLKQEIIDLIDKIESTKEFPAKSGVLCKWCGFRSYCPLMSRSGSKEKPLDSFI
ncbi:PD-(D/E)XK nuclease family protein [Candidatus Pacearchaeota archaeon]|nr:PD-(D/E)XK nuclease family protein [Candidatus Pacearchaeota archaeon]